MSIHRLLQRRAEADRPVRVGVIGAGKFATMFLARARLTPGLHLAAVADLGVDRARAALLRAGWPAEQLGARNTEAALRDGGTWLTDDGTALAAAPGLEVVVEATGDPAAGVRHALAAIGSGRHVVMVNVEADALVGPLLARRAAAAGVVYSLAYGDQPALIVELVDWARACGFEVVAAGKGTRYLPSFHVSTPDTVWEHWGITAEQAAAARMNPRMFNSFLDGTKSAIEMAAVANATGLAAAPDGLEFPPCGTGDLARVLHPRERGGCLRAPGQVEVVSSLERDGRPVAGDLRWGVYVVFRASDGCTAGSLGEYGLAAEGDTAALYRPYHLVGMELGISVATAALRGEPTGAPDSFRADVVAVAKRDLAAGELLDGEGGYAVWGRLAPAARSLALGALPIGLAHGVRLRSPVAAGGCVRWSDVLLDESAEVVRARREMEALFAPGEEEAA